MRKVILVITLVAAGLTGGRAAVAGPGDAFISISGLGTAFMDVRFNEEFTLDEYSTEIDSKGSFAGWLMHRLDEPFDATRGNVAGVSDPRGGSICEGTPWPSLRCRLQK